MLSHPGRKEGFNARRVDLSLEKIWSDVFCERETKRGTGLSLEQLDRNPTLYEALDALETTETRGGRMRLLPR